MGVDSQPWHRHNQKDKQESLRSREKTSRTHFGPLMPTFSKNLKL